ncbi:MAG: hypothetical protein V7723_18870, partial [Sneathiella sp.]|uniref:hypothetical protein n=1 Tax=Sneathiella sp. TaxID=1964365 RepID=UPI0030036EC7
MSKSPGKSPAKSPKKNKQDELSAAANVLKNNLNIDEEAMKAAARDAVEKAAAAAQATTGSGLGGNPHLGAAP